MTKYYFISYIAKGKERWETVYGSIVCKVTDTSFVDIRKLIAKEFSVTDITILCMKGLTKSEYLMLKGGENNE